MCAARASYRWWPPEKNASPGTGGAATVLGSVAARLAVWGYVCAWWLWRAVAPYDSEAEAPLSGEASEGAGWEAPMEVTA